MKTRILFACLVAVGLTAMACQDLRMCDEHSDCTSLCKTYENNDLLAQCTPEGNCLCLSEADISCTEAAACTPICEKYKPGSTPACIKESCKCIAAAVD